MRETFVDRFLNSGCWFFAEDRELTRSAVRDFLLEMSEGQLFGLARDVGVFVVATAKHLVATLVSYGFEFEPVNIPPSCRTFDRRIQWVHLSSTIENYDDSELRSVVFDALSRAFAVAAGLDYPAAVQLGKEAGRAQVRPRAWRTN
jgi:hypothetical protein